MIRESVIEKYLVKKIKSKGGQCVKLTGNLGIPDRMVLLTRFIIFIEVKTLTGKLTPRQVWWGETIQKLGFKYAIIRSKEEIDQLFSG